jgi:putative oxidoreductase
MLMIGFLGRINAALMFIVMIGALITVHWPNGFSINWLGSQKGEGYELDVLMYAMCSVIIINGSGTFSVDRLLSKNKKNKLNYIS